MNKPALQWRSLSTKITLAALGIFLAGIWSLSFYAGQILRKDMEARLGEQQFATVSLVASQVESELATRLHALEVVARAAAKGMQESGPGAMQGFLEERVTLQTLFNGGVLILDQDGTAVADYPSTAGRLGVNYIDSEVIAAALHEAKASIGKPVLGRKLKMPLFGLAVPLIDNQDRVIGALSAAVNLGIPGFLDQITESHYGKTGGYVLIARQQRLIVTATDKTRVMEQLPGPGVIPLLDRVIDGFEGSGVEVNAQGVEVLASVKRVPVADWLVVALLPTEEAFAPIRETQRRMLLATILLTLVAGLLTSPFGGSRTQISGPTGAFIVILAGVTARYGIVGLQVATLMEHVTREIDRFERNALASGVNPHEALVAKYALSGTADDIVQNLPGGNRGDRDGIAVTFDQNFCVVVHRIGQYSGCTGGFSGGHCGVVNQPVGGALFAATGR